MPTSQSPHPTSALATLRPGSQRSPEAPTAPSGSPGSRALVLPAVLAVVLASFALLTGQASLRQTFVGVAGALLLWCAALLFSTRAAHRALRIEMVPRRQHWVQACTQGSLILYWAAHNPLVVAFLPFILVQLIFAYAFDALLSWSRRNVYAIGFGPFPIILSINLFLLFKPEWFYWQFVLIAVGFLAKEFIRWTRDGKSAHIFNPSSFPLAVFSVALLLAGKTDVTFGTVIANTIFDTPHIYLAIFLLALPVQILFGVARSTLAAAVTMYVVGLIYLAATGTYLFYDAYIPAAVFIGMTLLVTDPSTSPRTDLGRLFFGVLYALGTIAFYVVLEHYGAPEFYDKLLPIPLMNLMVRWIERATRRPFLARLDPARLGRSLTPLRTNLAITSLWVAVFLGLAAVQGVGDKHPGQYLPFWHQACGAGSTRACTYAAKLTAVYCQRGSGWACNDIAIVERRLGRNPEPEFQRACDLGFPAGCENLKQSTGDVTSLATAPPQPRDLPIVLAGTKPPLSERDPAKLYALACDQGWPGACGGGWERP